MSASLSSVSPTHLLFFYHVSFYRSFESGSLNTKKTKSVSLLLILITIFQVIISNNIDGVEGT